MRTEFESFVHLARDNSKAALQFLQQCILGQVEGAKVSDRILAAKIVISSGHGKDASTVPDRNEFDEMSPAQKKTHLYRLIEAVEQEEMRYQ